MKKKEYSYAVRRKTINIVLACALAVGLAGLAGCGVAGQGAENGAGTQGVSDGTEQQPRDDVDASTLRSNFTEEELADGHASFQVSEHLYVDAEVTPADTYADGFATYYLETYEEGSKEEFDADPRIFGQEQEDFFATLSDVFGLSITSDLVEYADKEDEYEIVESFDHLPGDDGLFYSMRIRWLYPMGRDPYVYLPFVSIGTDDASFGNMAAMARGCVQYLSPDENTGLFLSEEEVASWMQIIEKLTGRKVNTAWDAVHITEDNVLIISKGDSYYEQFWLDWDADPADCYYFYYDLDGLPIDSLALTHTLTISDPEPCADDVTLHTLYSRIDAKNDAIPDLMTDGTQISLGVNYYYQPGEVYRVAQPVISPSEVLAAVEEYYSKDSLTADATVTQMRLVYAPYFTDAADGEIRNAYCVFWKVIVYDESLHENRLFLYDAFTGKAKLQDTSQPDK